MQKILAKKIISKALLVFLSVLVCGLTSGCGNFADLAQGFLYPVETANKTAVPNQPPAGYGQAMLDVAHPNGAMKIHVWYRANPSNAIAPVVIHFHGNGENIGSLVNGGFLAKMETLGSHFVVFDYPGYGRSTGFQEQSTLVAAAQATVAFTRKAFPNSPLVLWGWSLGSAVAFQTANLNAGSVRALITDSAWSSIRELAKDKFGGLADQIPEALYKRNEWNSLAIAPKIGVPLLMRHGSEDTMIPIAFGQKVAAAANPKLVRFLIVPGKNHGDIFADGNYWPDLIKAINAAK